MLGCSMADLSQELLIVLLFCHSAEALLPNQTHPLFPFFGQAPVGHFLPRQTFVINGICQNQITCTPDDSSSYSINSTFAWFTSGLKHDPVRGLRCDVSYYSAAQTCGQAIEAVSLCCSRQPKEAAAAGRQHDVQIAGISNIPFHPNQL